MRKHTGVFVILAVIASLMLISHGSNASEWRALEIDGWHNGMWTQGEIETMLTLAQTGHYNVIVPQIRKKADALYHGTYGGPSGNGEPVPTAQVEPDDFDPLDYMVERAHAMGIQVHPWVCTHRCPTTTSDWFYTTHNNWLTKNAAGALIDSEGFWLDPGVPDGEEYTVNVMLDIVSHYDIDGIQWDRIRYPGSDSGYNTIARNRYLADCAEFNPDPDWSDWRRRQLNDFVARVYAQIMEIKPHIVVAADTWADYTAGRGTYFQDASAWMANHTLDADCLMNYTGANTTYNSRLTTHLNFRNGRYVFSGHNISTSYNTQANSCQQILNGRSLNLSKGCPKGAETYSYYYATGDSAGWFTYVSASGRPYFTTDTVPACTWKDSPTQGIILGRVTDALHPNNPVYHDWIYNATVTLYHAGDPEINRTTLTDGTGYYVFTDVEPQTQDSGYTITISKNGFPTRVLTDQAIAATDVKRIDVELGTRVLTSSNAIPRSGKALLSVPCEPVDPDPAVVMAGIPIDGRLTRWDRAAQSTRAYDEMDPDFFGPMSLDQGYWLLTDSARTISYTGYGSTTASRSQSLPKAGWNLIGCPYETQALWAGMTVTSGTTTFSLEEARDNGWVSSVGVWWDSVNQSSRDVGLPDDFCYTDYLQPWHGHWFRSYMNNLTLTQKK